jgi:hypothetical protein
MRLPATWERVFAERDDQRIRYGDERRRCALRGAALAAAIMTKR